MHPPPAPQSSVRMSDKLPVVQRGQAARPPISGLPTMMSSLLGELSGNPPALSRLLGPSNPATTDFVPHTLSSLCSRCVSGRGGSCMYMCIDVVSRKASKHNRYSHRCSPDQSRCSTISQPSRRNHSKRSLPVTRLTNSTGPANIYVSTIPSAAQSPATATYQALCRAPFANPLLSEFAR